MRQKKSGRRNGSMWDLKYKINEDLEIKLKKCNNNYPIHNKQAKINIGGIGIRGGEKKQRRA